jgi:hypothetical protein
MMPMGEAEGNRAKSMVIDQLPFIVAIMALAINLLHFALPKDPF